MLEGILLWKVFSLSRQVEDLRHPPEDRESGWIVFLIAICFAVTMFCWPFNVCYRAGLWKRSSETSIALSIVVMVFGGIGFTAIYFLIGFVWACVEMALALGSKD